MTLQLELGGVEDPDVRRAFENVAQQFPLRAFNMANDVLLLAATGTVRKVAFGVDTLTFTASTISAAKAVNHGLGVTPVIALATEDGTPAGGLNGMIVATYSKTSSQFTAQGLRPTGAITGSLGFSWVAIG